MANSQNGWPANRRDLVSSRVVPGTTVRLTVRNGAAGDLLLEVASLFDRLVQDIDAVADDWGYAERPIRGSATISNHASGTAIDLNATRWALGSDPSVNLNGAQIDTVHRIVGATGAVVRWGGDYTGRKDPMHFEINDNRSEADCVRALDQLRAAFGAAARPAAPPAPREEDPMAIIPIRVDAAGRFHETAMVEAGGSSAYGERAAITMGSTWGSTSVAVTALNDLSAPLYQWSAQIGDNGFWAAELPGDARIVTIEGTVQIPADVPGADGSIAQPATRPAAAIHTRARP